MVLALDQKVTAKIGMILDQEIFGRFAAVGHQQDASLSRDEQLDHERLIVRAFTLEISGRKQDSRGDVT